jgi:hypothetical protein
MPITRVGERRCDQDGNTSLTTAGWLAGAQNGLPRLLLNLLRAMFNRKRERRKYRKRHIDHELLCIGIFECERNRIAGDGHDRFQKIRRAELFKGRHGETSVFRTLSQ